MSGSVGGATYGALARILAASSSLQTQYATLQEQTSTGDISQNYAGLPQTSLVLSLTAASTSNDTYTGVIAQAQGKASAMQTAITQITKVVSKMSAAALQADGTTSSDTVSAMAQQAQEAYSQVLSLLNTTYAGNYVFSGQDTSNAPVPDESTATTSGMYTQIGAQLQALTTTPSTTAISTVIANTVSIASSTATGTTVFSSYLASTAASGGAAASPVQISATQTVSLDLPANQNVGATSDPSISGTGNAVSDILRSLAVMANSTSGMTSNADFSTLMQNAASTLTSAGATLTQEGAAIGTTQDTLTTATSNNASMQLVIQSQLTGLTNVDMATAISKLQAVNTQLQTSYQVLALARSLNLASFL